MKVHQVAGRGTSLQRRFLGVFAQTGLRLSMTKNPEPSGNRTRLTEHASVSAHSRSRHFQTPGVPNYYAGGACAKKRSCGAFTVVAVFAMIVPETTMKGAAQFVFILADHPSQVQVVPSPQMRSGRSVPRLYARDMVESVQGDTGTKESADRSLLWKLKRIVLMRPEFVRHLTRTPGRNI